MLFDITCFTNTADEFCSGKKISPSGRDNKEEKSGVLLPPNFVTLGRVEVQ